MKAKAAHPRVGQAAHSNNPLMTAIKSLWYLFISKILAKITNS